MYFQLSIFFDFMLAMCSSVTEEDFVSRRISGRYGKELVTMATEEAVTMQNARRRIWKDLHQYKVKSCTYKESCEKYLSTILINWFKHIFIQKKNEIGLNKN